MTTATAKPLAASFRAKPYTFKLRDLPYNPEVAENVLAIVESMLSKIEQHKDLHKRDPETRRYDMCSARSTADQTKVADYAKEACGGGKASQIIQQALETRGICHTTSDKNGPGTFSFSWRGDNLMINYHGHSRVKEEIEGELRGILEQLVVDVKEARKIPDPENTLAATNPFAATLD